MGTMTLHLTVAAALYAARRGDHEQAESLADKARAMYRDAGFDGDAARFDDLLAATYPDVERVVEVDVDFDPEAVPVGDTGWRV